MENINLKVIYCKHCKGYRTSKVSNEINSNHDDIIDHFFYHGSPWFTFDNTVFSYISSKEDVMIKEIELSIHQKNDRNYCQCDHITINEYISIVPPTTENKKTKVSKGFSDAEYYFKDVYHLSSMFH